MFKVPWASALLVAALVAVYAFSSGGNWYPDVVTLSQNAFGAQNPLALLFYVGYHLGVQHLAGNLVPLVFFAVLLESAASGRHVVAVFFLSGFLAALAFAFLSPGSLLAGASGGVAGLMAAGALVRPKVAAVLLLGVPLLSMFVVLPLLDAATSSSFSQMEVKAEALEQRAADLEERGQAVEAEEARAEADRVVVSLEEQKQARAKEASAQPDFWVHLAGALAGALYAVVLLPGLVEDGFDELSRFLFGGGSGGKK
ncbi:rhomboid family intramembrane serine protease [Candidatus Micrarchaeota archaeon]|nr:rhomboid family intramembrane serine protease [Candidatus Micrarchaeota archaeon]